MLRGAEDLRACLRAQDQPRPVRGHSPTASSSWEEVECLGACVNAPLVMIGTDTYEDLTPESFEAHPRQVRGRQGRRGEAPARRSRGRPARPKAARRRCSKSRPPSAPTSRSRRRPSLLRLLRACSGRCCAPAPALLRRQSRPSRTTAARPKDTTEETAPALKSPSPEKVSTATAESERKAANASAKADGKPNKAMREKATGAESPAGKIDAGKTDTKAKRVAAAPTVTSPTRETGGALFTPPAGQKDDLKLISGVGPGARRPAQRDRRRPPGRRSRRWAPTTSPSSRSGCRSRAVSRATTGSIRPRRSPPAASRNIAVRSGRTRADAGRQRPHLHQSLRQR